MGIVVLTWTQAQNAPMRERSAFMVLNNYQMTKVL